MVQVMILWGQKWTLEGFQGWAGWQPVMPVSCLAQSYSMRSWRYYLYCIKIVDDDIVRWILWSCIVNIVHLWRWCPGAVIRASGEGQSVPSSHSTPPLYNSSLWVVFLPFHHFGRSFEHLHCTLTIPQSNPISDSIPHQFSVVLV